MRKIICVLGLLLLVGCSSEKVEKEMSVEEIFDEFDGLTKIQIQETIKEYKGMRITTSMTVDKISKQSLSSGYVVKDMYDYPYTLSSRIKAFFPKKEIDKLLTVNIGDVIVFSGDFTTYKQGITSYIEFGDAEFIRIQKS